MPKKYKTREFNYIFSSDTEEKIKKFKIEYTQLIVKLF